MAGKAGRSRLFYASEPEIFGHCKSSVDVTAACCVLQYIPRAFPPGVEERVLIRDSSNRSLVSVSSNNHLGSPPR